MERKKNNDFDIRLTGRNHLKQARHRLVADPVDGPAGQRAVVQVGDGRVPENAGRAVRIVSFQCDVDRFARVVELPPESHGGRVGVHFAQHFHDLAAGRADHQHPVRLAARCVCER